MHRIQQLRIFAAVALLGFLTPFAAVRGQDTVKHVVLISLDGLAGIHLENYLKRAPQNFPTFARLMREGSMTFNARCDFHYSETIPNHISMFTGRPVTHPETEPDSVSHGYISNAPLVTDTIHANGNTNVAYKASVFDVVHDHGLRTAFYASKSRLDICRFSYDSVRGAPDLIPPDHGRKKIDEAAIGDLIGAQVTNVVNVAVANLRSQTPANFMFLHLSEPDLAGHTYTWGSATYSNMVMFVDRQVNRLLDAIEASDTLKNRTAIILTSDHGGGGGGFPLTHVLPEHPLNYTVPFFLWGPQIPGGKDVHALFRNRTDPGPGRPDYNARAQPIRNSDSGNVALQMLGLGPIPGSTIRPILGTNITVNIEHRAQASAVIAWPDDASAFILESTDSLENPQWEVDLPELNVELGRLERFITASNRSRYFRLRKP